jgi:hypothetical protein
MSRAIHVGLAQAPASGRAKRLGPLPRGAHRRAVVARDGTAWHVMDRRDLCTAVSLAVKVTGAVCIRAGAINRGTSTGRRSPLVKGDTFMRLRAPRSGMPFAVMVLAAAIGFLGYNLGSSPLASATSTAGTASHVNIADPTHTRNLAHVNSAGALSTNVSGLVSTVPGTPATPLNLDTTGVVGGPFTELVEPTTAQIDLTSLTVAVDEAENGGGHVRVFFLILEVPAGTRPGECAADATSDSEIQIFDLQAGTTAILSPASPIVIAPRRGKDVCLDFGAEPDTGSSTGQVHVSATGFVASGTYTGPHGTGSGGLGPELPK